MNYISLCNAPKILSFYHSFSFHPDPPKFEKDIKDQKVEVGEQLKIKIPYSGSGPFDVKLKKDNRDVPESNRIKITPFDDYLILVIKGNYYSLYIKQNNVIRKRYRWAESVNTCRLMCICEVLCPFFIFIKVWISSSLKPKFIFFCESLSCINQEYVIFCWWMKDIRILLYSQHPYSS